MEVTEQFLKGKIFAGYSPWAKSDITFTAQSTNISRLSDSVFSFTEHNYLPSDETDILDGHYSIFVNYKTFQYLVYKSSDYGSFTYALPCEFNGFLDANSLPETSKKKIESVIASKLLGAYFHNGKNLIGDITHDQYHGKSSLICDYRGEIWSDMIVQEYGPEELKALNILCGFVQPNIKDFDDSFVKDFVKKFKRKKGTQQAESIMVGGTEYMVVHQVNVVYGNNSALLTKDEDKISVVILDHKLKDFIKSIPTVLRNFSKD